MKSITGTKLYILKLLLEEKQLNIYYFHDGCMDFFLSAIR